jgi:tetratricopeptide (TPR) repeat protein
VPLDVDALRAELRRRAEKLQKAEPRVAAQVLIEQGLLEAHGGEGVTAALRCFEQAAALAPGQPSSLGRRRRLLEGKPEVLLAALDDELKATQGDERRADLLSERARLCLALNRAVEARTAFREALRLVPEHGAALRGLLGALEEEAQGTKGMAAELEVHLGLLASTYHGEGRADGDPRLVAWLQVERAALLDGKLGQPEQALAALRRAVALQPLPGAVRDALTRFLVAHKHEQALGEALEEEAEFETDNERSARLLYTAARLRAERLKQPAEAIRPLTLALQRSTAEGPVRHRILLELRRLHEEAGRTEDVAAIQAQLLPHATEPQARASEHLHLFELLRTLGRDEAAKQQARHALELFPDDTQVRERLDDVLAALGQHEERVALWLDLARDAQALEPRIGALLRAAEIEHQTLGRPREAIAHLRAAWSLLPGDPRLFDALSALLVPPPRDATEARGVRTRLELYQEAVRVTEDPERKIALLEKIAAIWEDELFDPARAADELDRVLAIDPHRRTAMLALQRNATRAGNRKLLVRALILEADVATDPALKRRLLLRAAEVTRDSLDDRGAAFQLLKRAEALDPIHPDLLRARATHARLAGRHDEVREALLALLSRHPKLDAFPLWIEIARLDEHQRKNPRDAVASYRQAARLRPAHPAPYREIVRLLRRIGDGKALVEALQELASAQQEPEEQARLLLEAADLQELTLGDDEGALRSLQRAGALPCRSKQAIHEAMERILQRRGGPGLAELYRRWIEETPPGATRQRLRVALAWQLQDAHRGEAVEVLQQALAESRELMPAQRLLRALLRRSRAPALAALLREEIATVRSSLARRGALWELVTLEELAGDPSALATYERIIQEDPRDSSALDSVLRLAGRRASQDSAVQLRLRRALQQRRELLHERTEQALFFLEEALVRERHDSDDERAEALPCYQAALKGYPESLLAARGLSRLASLFNHLEALVQAETTLGSLVEAPSEQALHLVRAADLLSATKGHKSPIELYEQALARDPDCTSAATSLVLLLSQDASRLVAALAAALDGAQAPAQIVYLGSEIGRTVLLGIGAEDRPPASVGIAAVTRALTWSKDAPSLLMLLARLQVAARLWPEARDALLRLLEATADRELLLAAHFELLNLYRGPLADDDKALATLRALLALAPHNLQALEELHRLGLATGDQALVIEALSRLAESAPAPPLRVEYDLALAEAQQAAGNPVGRVEALCDAILFAGSDPRPWDGLARLYRLSTREGASAYAEALLLLLRKAEERRIEPAPRWLSALGMLEATTLFRQEDALRHLQRSVELPGATVEEVLALGQGLEVLDQNAEAIRTLRELLSEGDGLVKLAAPGVALATLEAALAKEGRTEEQLPVQEVRACLGGLPEDWVTSMRTRRLPAGSPQQGSAAGAELNRLLLPGARSPMTQVALALGPIAAKVLGFSLSALGVSSRERVSPRDGHPTRVLAERLARALGVESFELYLASSWPSSPRAYPGDPPLLVLPASVVERPELEQAVVLGRLLFRVAVGLPFLDDFPPDRIDGFLVSALCATEPTMASLLPAPRERAAQPYLAPMQKAIGRRQRKQIEEVIAGIPTTFDIQLYLPAMQRSERRVVYLLTGALLSCVDALRRNGEAPEPLLRQPFVLDLFRFALSESAVIERWRIGSTWTERRPAP